MKGPNLSHALGKVTFALAAPLVCALPCCQVRLGHVAVAAGAMKAGHLD